MPIMGILRRSSSMEARIFSVRNPLVETTILGWLHFCAITLTMSTTSLRMKASPPEMLMSLNDDGTFS